MKVIQGTQEELQSLLDAFDEYGRIVFIQMGRELTEEGWLISRSGNSVTKTYGLVQEDSVQGLYITHPDTFRGRWDDPPYIEGLLALIPETLTVNLEFVRTPSEDI